jgi:signal peptidase I
MRELRSWILIIIIALLLSLLVRTYVVQPYRVEMTSMYNTLTPNDLVLVDKVSYKLHPPRRGDVVVFVPPNSLNDKYIKRIIGLSGETISVQENTVYIDGIPLNEPYLHSPMLSNLPDTKIPEGYYFVMGDNRSVSLDSRSFGPVQMSSMVGKAIFVYWPFNHIEGLCAYSGETP